MLGGARYAGSTMRIDSYTKLVLSAIALLLAAIAFRPVVNPAPALAQVHAPELYIEPGVEMLRAPDGTRQQLGKVVIDLHSGKIWGFPTGGHQNYPLANNNSAPPPVSAPFLLGRFELEALDK
jgi:hypothetical protein